MALATFQEWEFLRASIRQRLVRELTPRFHGLRLEAIDREALREAASWSGRRYPHWNWATFVRDRGHSRFELSIWIDTRLCGLAVGSRGPGRLEIDYVEGEPARDGPLRGHVAEIAIACAELHAAAIDVSEVRIVRPVPALLAWYAKRGYRDVVARGFEIEYISRSW